MKIIVDTFLSPFRMIGTLFNNDSHFIVSKRGYEVLNCEHKEWDQDIQIRVIQCRECGMRSWLRDTKDIFKNKTT